MPHVVSADGTRIGYDRTGEGPAVVLVDGATGFREISRTGARIAELLAGEHTVVTYDRRGRGESGDTAPYAVAREIEDIDALIAEVGAPAGVYGMSSGAILALDAVQAGSAVDRLALYEPAFIVDDSRPPLPGDYVERLDALVGAGRRREAGELFLTAALAIPAEMAARMAADPSFDVVERIAHTLAYDGRVTGTTMSGAPLPAGRWDAVSIPVLVMDGGASESFMHTGADALAALLPDARRETLAGQTHQVDPEVLAPLLAAFF